MKKAEYLKFLKWFRTEICEETPLSNEYFVEKYIYNELELPIVTNCTEIEAPYFDKKGKEIKEFALLKIYHFFGVNDQGIGRKHHYMYKWVCLEEYKGKKYWSALHLTNGDGGKFRLRAVADKRTRIIAQAEIIQSY